MAMNAYKASAKEAPRPTASPDLIPYCKVLLIHINAIAPTGKARQNPDKIPIKKVSI
jgi:hypothetical protein